MEETFEDLDSQNQEEISEPTTETELGLPADPIEVEPKDEDADDIEAVKQRNQELYEQLKKAKGFIRGKDGKWIKKEVKPVVKEEPAGLAGVTTEELYSLVKANVPDEDTREVKLYARSHGISITEALKLPEVKALLKVKDEYRKTAEAANTGSTRRGSQKMTDEILLDKADKGELPESQEDISRLIRAGIEKQKQEIANKRR